MANLAALQSAQCSNAARCRVRIVPRTGFADGAPRALVPRAVGSDAVRGSLGARTGSLALGVYGTPAGRDLIEPRLQVNGHRPLLDGGQAVGELLGPAGADDRRGDGRIGENP